MQRTRLLLIAASCSAVLLHAAPIIAPTTVPENPEETALWQISGKFTTGSEVGIPFEVSTKMPCKIKACCPFDGFESFVAIPKLPLDIQAMSACATTCPVTLSFKSCLEPIKQCKKCLKCIKKLYKAPPPLKLVLAALLIAGKLEFSMMTPVTPTSSQYLSGDIARSLAKFCVPWPPGM